MAGKINPSMFLFDVPPLLMGSFCKLMDSGVDGLGWRDLASRILPSLLDVRCIETCSTGGKSPTQELMWSWAQQNKTVGDLLKVLDQMGHVRARSLFQSKDWCMLWSSSPPLYPMYLTDSENSFKPSPVHPQSVYVKGEKQKYLITYSDVTEGTRNFHHDLKIGGSAFAEVYCGRWGNKSFAVKVFKQENKAVWKGLWENFTKEIEVLQLYQHPHILELWGSFSQDDRFCLVYPYLHNGSLFQGLHEEVKRPLSWQERLNIIKGTAKAVYHLHTTQPCMVICGNITSSNILLDENLQPKLSDFGLAHLRPHTVNQSCTIVMDTASRSHLGYLPEEYIRDGKLSVKLDVYSLGMVILETCTGQKVIQESAKTLFLRDVVRSEFEEKGCVDACLRFLDPKVEHWPPSVALCLFRIGIECTSSRMRVRPGVDTVLEMLSQLLPIPAPPEDQPHTLDDRISLQAPYGSHGLAVSMPTEDDELYSPFSSLKRSHWHDLDDTIIEDKGEKCRKKRYLTLDDGDGRVVTASFRELQKECKLRHAWARTIHTFQGSEAETIVYVLGDSKGQNWQHFYTAVTRGQKRVYVVGREADIERAIRKMIIPRKTRLCNLVKKVVSQPGPEGEDTLTQSGLSQSPVETQNFGPSQISGFEPTQSTPILHTPNFSQPSSSTRPSCTRHLYKNIEEPDMSLQDDMSFSQTYSWSPMYICDEPSTTAAEFVSELSYHDRDAALMGTISSSPSDSSRPPKRPGQAEDCTTPSKLAKQTTSEESPLGCSRMKLLSITSPSPKPHGRQLFRESSSQKEHP